MVTRRTFLLTAAAAAMAKPAEAFVRVSPRDPRYLELSDGSPYVPIGLNLIAPPANGGMDVYREWLDKLSANGGNYVRAWLANPFWDTEHEACGKYDEAHAKLIEEMLGMAKERGIRVKMTIEHYRSIGGGSQGWADKPLHHVDHGGTATSMADYFNGEASRAQFRKKLDWMAQRFGDRPEIYGWELWNEINAVQGGDYLAWTQAMLPELHKRFPRNLCMQSLGSFDQDRVREAYQAHSKMAGNDIAQVHRYLDLGASLEICRGAVDVLAADAIREVLSYNPGRPVVLAESGAVEPKHSGPFKLYEKDKEGTLLHDILFAPFFAGAAGPGQIWHWDAYVAKNNLWHHFSRFAEVVKGIDPATEGFTPSLDEREHDGLRVYKLTGKKTTLVWARDVANDWRDELDRGEAPRTVSRVRFEAPRGRVMGFDPWAGKWQELKPVKGVANLPDFSRSYVLKIW